jgi:hypothetical protein
MTDGCGKVVDPASYLVIAVIDWKKKAEERPTILMGILTLKKIGQV